MENLLKGKPRNGIKYAQNGAYQSHPKCTAIYYLNNQSMFNEGKNKEQKSQMRSILGKIRSTVMEGSFGNEKNQLSDE